MCKIKLVKAWIKRKGKKMGVGRIRSKKLNEQDYMEKYVITLANIKCEHDTNEI